METPFTMYQHVTNDMIDHNGHVHDANYNIIFSEAINQFNYHHGLSLKDRTLLNYTLFTVEEHTSYLSELVEGDQFKVTIYLYNYDEKRVHFFSIMTQENGTTVATNEVMMLGIDSVIKKTAPFPQQYAYQIKQYYCQQPHIVWPKQLGHRINIPN